MHAHRPTRGRGFTLTEVMVVISIIAVIAALVVLTMKPAVMKARATKCANNQRQIVLGCLSYAADNKTYLPSPRTDQGGQGYRYTQCVPMVKTNYTVTWPWVAAYGANVAGNKEKTTAITNGKIWPYIGSLDVFKSPLDPENRLRSYSLSAFVGVSHPDELADYDYFASSLGIPLCSFNTVTMSRVKQPSKTIYCLGEDDSVGPNNQGWIISVVTSKWVDWPATWDPRNFPLAYCDGSFETYSFVKPGIEKSWDTFGHNWTEPPVNGVAQDWVWFKNRMLPGVIPFTGL